MNIRIAMSAIALAAACSGTAQANNYVENIGTLPILPAAPYSHVFLHDPGTFFDTINFDIAASDVLSSANPLDLSLNAMNIFHVTGLSYTVWDNVHPNETISYGTFNGDNSTAMLHLTAPGIYHVDITGAADGIAGGAYGVSLVTAVPEPASYAMLLGGLACIGLAGRRLRKPASAA